MLITELIDQRGSDNRDSPWCYFRDDVITFGQLEERVNAMARGLTKAGITKGDRVAVMLPNHPEHIYTSLALIKLGAVQTEVNVHLKEVGIRYLIEHLGARAVIADSRYRMDIVPALAGENAVELIVWCGESVELIGKREIRFEDVASVETTTLPSSSLCPDDLISISYTSGTTGPPKGVMLSERHFEFCAEAAGLVTDAHRGDILFLWEPFFHLSGIVVSILSIQRGLSIALVERFSASDCWNQIRRYRATHLHYLGGVIDLLLKQPARDDDANNPIRIAWGGAAQTRNWEVFERRFGVRIHEGYGLMEGGNFITANLDGKVGSIGKPLDNYEMKLLGEDGMPVKRKEIGEMVVRGRGPGPLMKGYFKNAEATAAILRDGWLYTGDLAYYDESGFLYFAGRKKDALRHRGENVSAWEVEKVVNMHPSIEECAVIGVPTEIGEQDIKVSIKIVPGRNLDPLELIQWCEKYLAYFQIPRYIEFVEEFPRTGTQRIRKGELSQSVVGCWDLEKSGYKLTRKR